jgi:hypothetical protein
MVSFCRWTGLRFAIEIGAGLSHRNMSQRQDGHKQQEEGRNSYMEI